MKQPACAVIGAGAAGSSAALHLARAGAQVRVFDQFAFGHERGSSHGPTRLLRLAYFEHPNYVPLLRRSLALWRSLEVEAGSTLFLQTGVLEAGPPDGFLVAGVKRAAEMHDLSVDLLSHAAFAERFPWFRLAPGDEALFEADAGYLLADRALSAQITLAEKHGAALHPDEAVRAWRGTSSGIILETEEGAYVVDRVIIAAGAWAGDFLGRDIAPVSPVEKSLFWVGDGSARFTAGGGLVPFAFETREARMFYGFPAVDNAGVKIGEHTGGRPLATPDERSGASSPQERARLDEFIQDYTPDFPREVRREQTCLYEMSPDANFLIGRHPEEPRVSFVAGLSGHGFKFAPLIGEAMAMLALDKDLPREFDFLSPSRFEEKRS